MLSLSNAVKGKGTSGLVAGMGKLGNANFIGRKLKLIATCESAYGDRKIQGDTKKRELLKNATKIEEIQEKKLTEIEPLQLAF